MNRKMKMLVAGIFGSVIAVSSFGQQTRQVGDFTGIKAGDAFNIVISQSDVNGVKVDAPDNMQGQIKTEVKDGILCISVDENVKGDKDVKILISVKGLSSLEISGSADVKTDKVLICDKLNIKSSGAGDVTLEVKANEIKTDISGAGDVHLKGSVAVLTADVSGAGDLKASNMEADKAKIKVSGAGDAKVNVKQTLDADVSGAGSIIYKGNPAERNVVISGAGSVRESKSGNGEETASDTTKFMLGKKKYMIIGDNRNNNGKGNYYSKKDSIHNYKNDFKHWRGIEIGVNGMLNYNNSLTVASGASFLEQNYAKSYQLGFNVFEHDFHLYKNYINLVTGLGLDFNHYAFSNSTSLKTDSSHYLRGVKDSLNYKKNDLNVSYLKVPLMLEINTSKNPHTNLHIAGGIEFAYRIHSVLKQKFETDDEIYRVKDKQVFNIEPFRYSAMVRIGYDRIGVFADYGLNRLFEKNKGPQEYPFTIGINISI